MSDISTEISAEIKERLPSVDLRRSLVAGGIATAIILIGTLSISVGSGSEAKTLLQGMLPTVRTFCSGLLPATTTLLALMLTAISFSHGTDIKIKGAYYDRIRTVAKLDVTVFIATVALLLFLTVPLLQSSNVPPAWYTVLYYFILVYAATLGGLVIATLMMLYSAVHNLLDMVHPDRESNIRFREEGSEG